MLLLIILKRIFIVLSAASGGISIISFASIIGAPLGTESVSFSLIFSYTTWIIKRYLK